MEGIVLTSLSARRLLCVTFAFNDGRACLSRRLYSYGRLRAAMVAGPITIKGNGVAASHG